jgi:PAS domain S-box-containing protein
VKKETILKAFKESGKEIDDHSLIELYRLILANVSSGVALIDEKGRFLLYNKEFLRLFGLSEESTINNVNDQNWSDWQVFDEKLTLLHVDDHPVRKAAITGNPVKNRLIAVRLPSGGDLIWMLVSAEPVIKGDGNVEKIICTYQDVTRLRHAEEKLTQAYDEAEKSRSELRVILDNAPIAIRIAHDPQCRKITGNIYANEGIMKVSPDVNISASAPDAGVKYRVFRNGLELKPEELPAQVATSTGKPYENETLELRFNDGRIIYLLEGAAPIFSKNGAVTGAVITGVDVTLQKKAEEALRESESNLRELIATKNKFFNIIAHDLKNPFTSLIGSSEILSRYIDQLDLQKIENLAEIINDASKRGYGILQNLLDWSRSQTGMLKICPEKINIRFLIDEHISEIPLNKQILITSLITQDVFVVTDRNVLKAVLRNLIDNALKFTHRNGKIYINATRKDGKHIISVRDTGVGIPAERIDSIFRPDSLKTMPGTENEPGTGLGLKICREFVEKLNGEIWVESVENEGSTFIFSIPSDEG